MGSFRDCRAVQLAHGGVQVLLLRLEEVQLLGVAKGLVPEGAEVPRRTTDLFMMLR